METTLLTPGEAQAVRILALVRQRQLQERAAEAARDPDTLGLIVHYEKRAAMYRGIVDKCDRALRSGI